MAVHKCTRVIPCHRSSHSPAPEKRNKKSADGSWWDLSRSAVGRALHLRQLPGFTTVLRVHEMSSWQEWGKEHVVGLCFSAALM